MLRLCSSVQTEHYCKGIHDQTCMAYTYLWEVWRVPHRSTFPYIALLAVDRALVSALVVIDHRVSVPGGHAKNHATLGAWSAFTWTLLTNKPQTATFFSLWVKAGRILIWEHFGFQYFATCGITKAVNCHSQLKLDTLLHIQHLGKA